MGTTANQMRGADVARFGQEADWQRGQQDVALRQEGLNDATMMGLYGLGSTAAGRDQAGRMGYESSRQGAAGANASIDADRDARGAAAAGAAGATAVSAYQGLASGNGGGGGDDKDNPPSDARSKTRIRELEAENRALRHADASRTVILPDGNIAMARTPDEARGLNSALDAVRSQPLIEENPPPDAEPAAKPYAFPEKPKIGFVPPADVRTHPENYEPRNQEQADWLAKQWFERRSGEAEQDYRKWVDEKGTQKTPPKPSAQADMEKTQARLERNRELLEHPKEVEQRVQQEIDQARHPRVWKPQQLHGPTTVSRLLPSDKNSKQEIQRLRDELALYRGQDSNSGQKALDRSFPSPELKTPDYGALDESYRRETPNLGRDLPAPDRFPVPDVKAPDYAALDESFQRQANDDFTRIPPKTWEYNKEAQDHYGVAPGRQAGIIAQDAEKAGPVAHGMISRGPDGMRVIDRDKALNAVLAATAEQARKLKEMEVLYPRIPKNSTGGL